MKDQKSNFSSDSRRYLDQLSIIFSDQILIRVEKLASHLYEIWKEERNLFICGNGGSAANAIHMANDFHFGVGACGEPPHIKGLKVEALTANSGILTCLANDIGYENIFSHQLNNKASPGDLLIVLSGSGNSKNICNVLETANKSNVFSYAILGFDGGKSLEMADCPIHFAVNDMQIAEDTQLIIGHLCMQWLTRNKPKF